MDIDLEQITEEPWEYHITLLEDDTNLGEFVVTMSGDEYRKYSGTEEPDDVIRATFKFLLAHEDPEMILERFSITTIEQHFPEYPKQLGDYF